MELKQVFKQFTCLHTTALIVPYGIETAQSRWQSQQHQALIVPYGIETSVTKARTNISIGALIVPYGIETLYSPSLKMKDLALIVPYGIETALLSECRRDESQL